MEQPKRVKTRSSAVNTVFLYSDIWSLIIKFSVDVHVNMISLCKSFYTMFGGVVKIMNNIVKLRDVQRLIAAARSTYNLESLLHQLQWTNLLRNTNTCVGGCVDFKCNLTNPVGVIQDAFQNFPEIKDFFDQKQKNTRESADAWNCGDFVLAGGFPRCVFVKAFQKLGLCPPCISQDANDIIDVFIHPKYSCFASVFFKKYYPVIAENSEDAIKCGIQIEGISQPIQIIQPLAESGLIMASNEFFPDIIRGFDFTCTQIAIYGHQWWTTTNNNFVIHVTPAFLYSILTGNMYLNYGFEVNWPFQSLDPDYLENGTTISISQKVMEIFRCQKYQLRGYKECTFTQEDKERMQEFMQVVTTQKRTHFEHLFNKNGIDCAIRFNFLPILWPKKERKKDARKNNIRT